MSTEQDTESKGASSCMSMLVEVGNQTKKVFTATPPIDEDHPHMSIRMKSLMCMHTWRNEATDKHHQTNNKKNQLESVSNGCHLNPRVHNSHAWLGCLFLEDTFSFFARFADQFGISLNNQHIQPSNQNRGTVGHTCPCCSTALQMTVEHPPTS